MGIEKGTSAAKLSREIRQYLNEPNKLFRRVRDEFGELRLSKNAKAYHSGAGVYRSSYKNAMRLARTEINMAYRYADSERWKQLDFVIGIRIQLSGSHPAYDICDVLADDYPPNFTFVGWHPQCLCFATPILQPKEDFLKGKEPKPIKDLPQNFKDWYRGHKEEIEKAEKEGKLPYFLRDNKGVINYSNNLKEYKRLKKNKNYYDVVIDRETGGLKAIHKEHNFDKTKGHYEKEVVDILLKNGYKIILGSENSIQEGLKIKDGSLDGLSMEISTKETGSAKNFKYGLNHCAAKGVDVAIIYFPNGISEEHISKGLKMYKGLHNKDFDILIILNKNKVKKI